MQRFVGEINMRTGKNPDASSALVHDALYILTDAIKVTGSLLLPLLLAAAASAQPFLLGPERAAPVRPGISSPSQKVMGTATDGTNQLVVWLDERNVNPAHSFDNDSNLAVVAARVDGRGNVLDVPNLVLPLQAYGTAFPFWNGHEYVVVTSGQYVRVSAEGELLDHQAQTFKAIGWATAIAWSGDRLFILSGNRAMVYDASFQVVRDEFVVMDNAIWQGPVAASNGSGFVVAFVDSIHGVSTVVLDRNGAIVRKDTLLARQYVQSPMIASDGERYLLLVRAATIVMNYWREYHFIGFTLNGEGVVIGGGATFGKPSDDSTPADLKWQGDKYALVFDTSAGIAAIALDRNGSPNGDGTQMISAYPHALVVSAGAGPRMLFWSTDTAVSSIREWHRVNGQPYADAATFAATNSERFVLGQGSLSQETPAVATAGDISLLVWRERESARGLLALYAARVDRYGRIVDQPQLLVTDLTCDALFPAVAGDGSDFLVVWQEGKSIRARRVGHDGRLLDPAAITVSADEAKECSGLPPEIVWNGSSYLVTWGTLQAPADRMVLRAKRIASDGTLLDLAPITLATRALGGTVDSFRTASDGHDFMIAWTERFGVFVTRVTSEGIPRDISGIALDMVGLSALFWSGTHYVVLAGGRYERVTPDGRRIDLTPQSFAARSWRQITCDDAGCFGYDLADGMINATRLDDTPSGLVLETKPFIRADAIAFEWRPVMLFGAGPLKNVAYLRMAPEPPYAGSWHLFVCPTLAPRGRVVR